MYPAAFEYYRATSVPEIVQLLQQHPDGKILAGGHSLLPLMKLRLAEPAALIDIGRVPDLSGIQDAGDSIVVGATTTYWDLLQSEVIRQSLPLITEAANVVGDIQVRNRGTLGGAMAHADPAADMPAVALALDASLKVVGPSGERTIPASEFFVDMFTTALNPDEVLTQIIFPKPQGTSGQAYEKFAHPASGYAVVGVAAFVTLDGGKVQTVRVGITGAGTVAKRASAVEQALAGQEPTEQAIESASAHAAEGLELNGDIFASEEYRAHLARVFTQRALSRAVAAARG
ncbi:FAD binding domain-containing protein [Sphaerobacter thermophilus]|mgnify:FL=1|jgi:carbon-monoxide dehydrogenase medium subunit|uniref:FAD binding domain-containing protein n=1 Tax=Sphaerobacter thermophilus TaxID=2057 RepID=UPI000DB877FC|nr:MAG: carbon monoxide dehydrogenase [Sphaerobacter thermophilus]